MDNPLRYQMTEYDCGPTSMLNAVSYLFRRDGAAVVRLDLEGWHYVLLTRIEGGDVYLFDPYYHEGPFDNAALRVTDEHPCSYNRIVPVHYFEREEISVYSLGPFDTREAILLFNTDTELTEDKTVEYFI